MHPYIVIVMSSGVSADWVDNVLVMAESPSDASWKANQYVREHVHPFADIRSTHPSLIGGTRPGRAIGTLSYPHAD